MPLIGSDVAAAYDAQTWGKDTPVIFFRRLSALSVWTFDNYLKKACKLKYCSAVSLSAWGVSGLVYDRIGVKYYDKFSGGFTEISCSSVPPLWWHKNGYLQLFETLISTRRLAREILRSRRRSGRLAGAVLVLSGAAAIFLVDSGRCSTLFGPRQAAEQVFTRGRSDRSFSVSHVSCIGACS